MSPTPTTSTAELRRLLREGGFPGWKPEDPDRIDFAPRRSVAPRPERPLAGTVALTVCTRSHLPSARVLLAGLRRHAPGLPLRVIVVDATPGEDVALPGAEVVAGEELGDPRFPWMTLKFLPAELCCALKPTVVRQALEQGAARVLYLDSDIQVLGPLDTLLAPLDDCDWVVVPHARRQLDPTEAVGGMPDVGDLTLCGVLNAGLFSVRRGSLPLRYLERWGAWCRGPEAFLGSWWGGLTEQQLFGWVVSCGGRVEMLADPAQNVAYWNLHERAVGFDGERFTVEGLPLSTFHWSGFDPDDATRLSTYDSRHSPLYHPELAELCRRYREELVAAGWRPAPAVGWRWSRLPSGIEIDPRIRDLVRRYERVLDRGDDPWSEPGERRLLGALLSPLPATGTLLPLLFADVYRERSDLRWDFPEAATAPERFFRWIACHGVAELGYAELLDRARPTLPAHGIETLVEALAPAIARGERVFGEARRSRAATLRESGRGELAAELEESRHEIYAATPLAFARELWRGREDFRRSFSDPLGADLDAYAGWLRTEGAIVYLAPEAVARALERSGGERALARIHLRLAGDWKLMQRYPLALAGESAEPFAAELLRLAAVEPTLDADDVVAFLWTLDSHPERLLRWLFALPIHLRAQPSTAFAEGRRRLLEPLVERYPRLAVALAEHELAIDAESEAAERRLPPAVAASPARRVPERLAERAAGTTAAPRRPIGLAADGIRGVHLFGQLGAAGATAQLTAGSARALATLGVPVVHAALDGAFDRTPPDPGELLRLDPRLDTLLFVFRADREELPLERLPPHRRAGRRKVALLVWESPVAQPHWGAVLDEYDDVWAPSAAAAGVLGAGLGRAVAVVPPALDASLPERERSRGPRPEHLHVLATLQVLEAIDRQNLEGTVEAFRRAFAGSRGRRATLWLRAVGRAVGERRERLRRFHDAVPAGLDVRIVEADRWQPLDYGFFDAYLALDRAEPTASDLAQAIAAGLPAVASRAGAHRELVGDDGAAPVEVREVEVERTSGSFRRGALWAEADLDAAAALVRRIFEEPEASHARAARARERVRRERSAEAVGARVAELVGWR